MAHREHTGGTSGDNGSTSGAHREHIGRQREHTGSTSGAHRGTTMATRARPGRRQCTNRNTIENPLWLSLLGECFAHRTLCSCWLSAGAGVAGGEGERGLLKEPGILYKDPGAL